MMKTRFAPSPTGLLHLGNARTALFSYLLAQRHGGSFILRIEDTDQARSTTAFTKQLQEDLRWLGLDWDLGPGQEDTNGPYLQSLRASVYVDYYRRLQETGAAYPCFCTAMALQHQRQSQLAQGLPPRYSGVCRSLSPQDIANRQAKALPASLRFRVPEGELLSFQDLLKGEQSFESSTIGDFVIRRTDGSAAFLFCNALDDALMGVTHVLRGEDHVSNTPRQRLLLQALKLPCPQYGHMPLILGESATPLAKREGPHYSLKALREAGYLPIAVQNYLARLGHRYLLQPLVTLSQLAKHFSLNRIGKSAAHFDVSQLQSWQKQGVQALAPADFWRWLGPETHALVPKAAQADFCALMQSDLWFPQEAEAWATILFTDPLPLDKHAQARLSCVDTAPLSALLPCVQQHGTDSQMLLQAFKEYLGGHKSSWQAARLALTGRLDGPSLAAIVTLMGAERAQRRITSAVQPLC